MEVGNYLDHLGMESCKCLNLQGFKMANYSNGPIYLKVGAGCQVFDQKGIDITHSFDWTNTSGSVKLAIMVYGVFCYGLGQAKLCMKVSQIKKTKDDIWICYV